MNTNTNVRNEILASIDNINDVVLESDFSVLGSMADAYDKTAMILESFDGSADDLGMFAIFQEADEAAAKPEGEASVQQGEAPANATANAVGKNEGILTKIWNFIKRIFKAIGDFFKRCWSGAEDITETVSDKTGELINKLTGKDESWVKEHAAELGLTGGLLAFALSIVGIINRDKISQAVKEFSEKMGTFFTNFKGAYTLDFSAAGIKTNINFTGVTGAIKKAIAVFKVSKDLASKKIEIPKVLAEYNELVNTPVDQLKMVDTTDEPTIIQYSDVIGYINEIKKTYKDAGLIFDSEIKQPEGDQNTEDDKKLASAFGAIAKFLTSIGAFFKKQVYDRIVNLLSGQKKAEQSGDAENTENAGTTATEETSEEGASAADETAGESEGGEEKTFDPAAVKKGDVLSSEDAIAFLHANNQYTGVTTPDELAASSKKAGPSGKLTTGKGGIRPNGDGTWTVEYDETEVEDDEDVVEESASNWYTR